MSNKKKYKLADVDAKWSWIIMSSLLWFCFVALILESKAGEYIEKEISPVVDFQVRDWLGQNPKISDKLKVLVLDDATLAGLDDWVLSIDDWAILLSAIDKAKPHGIFVDQMWSKPIKSGSLFGDSIWLLEQMKTPLTGAVLYRGRARKNQMRYLNLDTGKFSLTKRLNISTSSAKQMKSPKLHDISQLFISGPAEEYTGFLRKYGHIVYGGKGEVAPLAQVDFDTIVPHAFLALAEQWSFEQGQLLVNDTKVAMDSTGHLPVNFFAYDKSLYASKKIMSLRYFLNRAKSSRPLNHISEGDTVMILPHFYTGNTDVRWTPVGRMPAGLVPVALVNSALTGQWLTPVGHKHELLLVAALIGAVLAVFISARVFLGVFVSLLCLLFVAAMVFFSYLDMQTPWLPILMSFTGSTLTVFVLRTKALAARSSALRHALEGAIHSDDLDSMLKSPENVNLEPRERVVTLMFVDIVGFSKVSENLLPRRSFGMLKLILDEVSEVIHRHGGVVDKSLGDGLLCYFGYSFENDSVIAGHAEAAVRAAVEIQQKNLQKLLSDAQLGSPLMPLRIGINTSSCFLGDLGSERRIEFTVIGNGVNFAKRLESSCNNFRILFSDTTRDLVKHIGFASADKILSKKIKIKHHEELIEAFELNPFFEEQGLEKEAVRVFERYQLASRNSLGLGLNKTSQLSLELKTNKGTATLLSIGNNAGLGLCFDSNFEVGEEVKVLAAKSNGVVPVELIKEFNAGGVVFSVKWSYQHQSGYMHGVESSGISASNQSKLLASLGEVKQLLDGEKTKEAS